MYDEDGNNPEVHAYFANNCKCALCETERQLHTRDSDDCRCVWCSVGIALCNSCDTWFEPSDGILIDDPSRYCFSCWNERNLEGAP